MAKFTWTIESDDPKEAVRINEEMAAMVYRINKTAKSPLREPGVKARPADFEVVDPATEERRLLPRNAKGVREAVDQMVAWAVKATTEGELKQLVGENQEIIRTLMNEKQRARFARHVAEREAKLASEARLRAAPPPVSVVDEDKPTQEELSTEFRALYDIGGDAACREVLARFKVETLKDLPENLWPDVLVSIRSSVAARAAQRE